MARKSLKRQGTPLYPEHPASEHAWRVQRARKLMEEDNLDALVLSRNVNVFYLTGSRFGFVGFDTPVVLCPQSCAIITPSADIYCQRFGPFDTDAVAEHTTMSESFEHYDDELELVSILKDYGIRRGQRIGIEWGPGLCTGINPVKFEKLSQSLEKELGAEFVDATPTIWRMTGIKSKLEIERMKFAVAASAQAMARLLDSIEIGMTELEVARRARIYMHEAGADRVGHAEVMGTGNGPDLITCDPVDRPLQAGYVQLDWGAKYKHYWSDISRGIFLGRRPTKNEIKLYECRVGVNGVMDRTIKPGVCVDDVLAEVNKYVQKCGCVMQEFEGMIFGGHGIGLEMYQQPGLFPSSAQPAFQNNEGKVLFQPGMMFTLETAIELPGAERPFFNVEDDVVVTETGVENMNSMLSRELRVRLDGSAKFSTGVADD
jgi:Xaa-Pro aminopeptidase